MLNNVHNDCLSCLLSELNRCHLDLSELNRLIQSLQTLEVGQAFTNGDLKRIISIQVDLFNQPQILPPSQAVLHENELTFGNILLFKHRIFHLRSQRSRGRGRCGATRAHCPEWRPWEW